MARRQATTLIGVMVVIALVVWLIAVDAPSDSYVDVASVDTASGRLAPPHPTSTPAAGETGRADPNTEREEVAAPETAAPAPRLVRGRVVLVDDAGGRFAQEDGSLGLTLRTGDVTTLRQVRVRRGSFETTVAAGVGAVEVRPSRIAGRRCFPSRRSPSVPGDGMWMVELRCSTLRFLRVRDARTGADLTGIDFVTAHGERFPVEHPGAVDGSDVVARATRSPVPLTGFLDPIQGRWDGFVRSPGYAWQRVTANPNADRDTEVELVQGGDLRVRRIGPAPAVTTYLRLRRRGEAEIYAESAPRDRVEFRHVEVGEYEVSIEIFRDGTVVLAEDEATVRAGVTTEVVLTDITQTR